MVCSYHKYVLRRLTNRKFIPKVYFDSFNSTRNKRFFGIFFAFFWIQKAENGQFYQKIEQKQTFAELPLDILYFPYIHKFFCIKYV